MNVNDSDWLRRALLDRGFSPAEFEDARIHILNTCSVREKPENKVYTELGRIRMLARRHAGRGVFACVGGCVAQQVGERLFKRSKELRLVFGTDGISLAPEAIAMLAEKPEHRLSLLDFSKDYAEREHYVGQNRAAKEMREIVPLAAEAPANTGQAGEAAPQSAPSSAFVNIMQGCDNFCAYCIVPFVRGRQKSRKSAAILDECRLLLENGTKELTLLGQNVNSYGLDSAAAAEKASFVELLHAVAALPGLERLHFVTPHPKDMPAELISAFAELPQLSSRLHLPLQAGSDRILKKMGRKYDLARYFELVESLRRARPDLQLSTDIIVGFPGETEKDFEATLEAMQRANFASSFSFVYSDRPGTRASKMEDKIPRAVGLERLARLQKWQDENTARILAGMVGSRARVLIEGGSLKPKMPGRERENLHSVHGRDEHGFSVNIPVQAENIPEPGQILYAEITGAGRHTLKGRVAE